MQYFILVVTIIAMVILAKLFSWPFKKIVKLVFNIVLGLILILLINNFGQGIGLHIPFNTVTALVAGILGLPGVAGLAILNYIF